MIGINKLKSNGSAGARAAQAPVRRVGRGAPEAVALGVLLAGAGIGLVLWAKWGFVIALETVAMYCF